MGCWNETCMVSHLPIHYGDRVVAIPIIESTYDSVGVYSTDRWGMFLPPVRGEYDDYGNIENADDPVFEELAKAFLPERSELLNLSGAKFIESFLESISRGEHDVELPQRIKLVFVHESIFDEMINACPRAARAWEYCLRDDPSFKLSYRLARGVYRERQACYPSNRKLLPLLQELDPENCRAEEMVKFTYALDDLRMCYHPTTGSGSQDDVNNFMKDMHEKFFKMAKEFKRRNK